MELLRDTGVFRVGFARSRGGPELNSIEQTEVIEALSYGDAAAGWCAMIGSDSGLYAQFLDEPVAKEMFTSLDMVTAGLLFPVGRADRVSGGYRLTGRWPFGSGITHADWVISGAFVHLDGQPEPGANGEPHDSKLFIVPRTDVEVIDTWHTTGLAGSGSCDYAISDLMPPIGVGVNLAMLDGHDLALATHPTVAEAVRAYENTMLPRSNALAEALVDSADFLLKAEEQPDGHDEARAPQKKLKAQERQPQEPPHSTT
ncbi:hypothetical protein [Kitasatospora sp. NPDC002040]|uniref:hypothetical protein n=1 Tax=Kitasatospora sp. NPDC002040 TaxID=3154661 RepID=UPI00332585A4